jgi:hypothetical protein
MKGWYVVQDGKRLSGPFHYVDSALMRLTTFPSAHVEYLEIGGFRGE